MEWFLTVSLGISGFLYIFIGAIAVLMMDHRHRWHWTARVAALISWPVFVAGALLWGMIGAIFAAIGGHDWDG